MKKLLGKTVTTEMLQAGQDAWLKDPAKRSSILWQAMFDAAPDYTENLVEAIAEEIALFERGSRATLGWHIKRALMGEGMHGASSAAHLGNTLKTDAAGSIPASPALDEMAKAIADALPDTWRNEAFMDLVNIAAKATHQFATEQMKPLVEAAKEACIEYEATKKLPYGVYCELKQALATIEQEKKNG